MSRIARVVVLGIAHRVTQRGNRCWRVFLNDEDYEFYQRFAAAAALPVLAPKHGLGALHAKPCAYGGRAVGARLALARTFADTHRRKTWHVSARNRWTGHLRYWRFGRIQQ